MERKIALEVGKSVTSNPGYGSRRHFGVKLSLALLLGVYTLNFLDRQIINILAESIKHELAISDGQLGLLTGLSFALIYGLLGLPVARLAERVNRPYIIAVSLAVWSGFTVISGSAQSFWQLAAARFGVGVGEAGGTPPAYALISDMVPRERRGLAISIYSTGLPLGSLLGLVIGGIVADSFGWRAAFALVGMPGILLAMLVALKLPEPRNHRDSSTTKPPADIRVVGKKLLANRSYFAICIGAGLIAMTSYGQGAFIAPFFLRSHAAGMQSLASTLQQISGLKLGPLSMLGLFYGLTHGIATVAGAVLGGWLSDKYSPRWATAPLFVPIFGALTSVPLLLLSIQSTDYVTCTLLLMLPAVALATTIGPLPTAVQGLVDPLSRATASAVYLLMIAIVGVGLGPVLVGVISDTFASTGLSHAEALRRSMMTAELPAVIGCGLLWFSSRYYAKEIVS